ncbi:MAG: hypothetical protein IKN76_04340, partial [Oscillospiraceae bacterium]|nr:hypothetical protein [Oscillospiraceae bacterium]
MNLQTSNIKEKVITVIATVLGCLHLYTAVAGILPLYQHRSIHLCVMLVLGFLMWSPKKENAISKVAKVWNALMIAASVVVGVYMAVFYYDIQFRQGHPSTADVVMCVLLMIVVLDATRKKAGYPIFVITVIFCLYVLFGHYLNGTLRHAKLSTSIIVAQFFNTTGGVLASPIGITSTYIIIFIIFGAFLEVSGAGE